MHHVHLMQQLKDALNVSDICFSDHDRTGCHHPLIMCIDLPTKKQYEVGMKKRGTNTDIWNQRTICDLKNYLNEYKEFPKTTTNNSLSARIRVLRKNPKYSKIIKELEIEYGYRLRSKEATLLEFKEYVLKHKK